ncbi:MAG: MarR family transcriptional regulator [Elusimicrobia bacterium]|nr:MarR family transcriptional regulator [Elusimicrobiota bacterium]
MHSSFILKNISRRDILESLARRYPECDRSAQEVFLALLSVAGAVMESIESHLWEHKTSQGRLRILLELDQAAGHALAAGELAQNLGITPATVTGLLDGLERSGQVRRERRREDRRGVTARMTPRGAKFLAEVMPERFRRNARLMAGLSRSDRRELVRLLETVSRGLEGTSRP